MKTTKLLLSITIMLLLSIISFGQTSETNEEQKKISETPIIENDSQFIGAKAGDDSYIGTICMFAGNFAPRGWAFCHGQLVAISDNPSLFSILGTTYGGDGVNTFGLPDLRGRVPIGAGTGIGLTTRLLGEMSGYERVSITEAQMPVHTHVVTSTLNAGEEATSDDPQNNYISGNGTIMFSTGADVSMMSNAISNNVATSGQGNSHYNM